MPSMSRMLATCGLVAVGCSVGDANTMQAPKCFNPAGVAVDYYYAIKHPKGEVYSYMDAATKGWEQRAELISDKTSAVSRTVEQLYSQQSTLSSVAWNDEPPAGGYSMAKAHAKGLLAFAEVSRNTPSAVQGIWLTHSWPKFPAGLPNGTSGFSSAFTTASPRYGQSFACVTVDQPNLVTLSEILSVTFPDVFYTNFPVKLAEVQKWAGTSDPIPGQPTNKVVTMKSIGGREMTVLGKSRDWGKDIFVDLVAPYFKVGFHAETWQNGFGKLGSNCSVTYPVENVAHMTLNQESWKESEDHSKWGVSSDAKIFCMGDINRMSTQRRRGGLYQCVQDSATAGAMAKAVTQVVQCQKNKEELLESVVV